MNRVRWKQEVDGVGTLLILLGISVVRGFATTLGVVAALRVMDVIR